MAELKGEISVKAMCALAEELRYSICLFSWLTKTSTCCAASQFPFCTEQAQDCVLCGQQGMMLHHMGEVLGTMRQP